MESKKNEPSEIQFILSNVLAFNVEETVKGMVVFLMVRPLCGFRKGTAKK